MSEHLIKTLFKRRRNHRVQAACLCVRSRLGPFALSGQSWPAEALAGKIVMDIMNHYPDRDGLIEELEQGASTTSELIARQLPASRVVKAFNAIMANDLERNPRPAGSSERVALPIADDDAQAKAQVAALVEEIGFDVVDAGSLAESWRIERARPTYCIPMDKATLHSTLAATTRDSWVGEYSWRAAAQA